MIFFKRKIKERGRIKTEREKREIDKKWKNIEETKLDIKRENE